MSKTVIAALAFSAILGISFAAIPVSAEEIYDLEMNVGDTFSYVPETNLMDNTTFTASGDAMMAQGGFLTFDGTEISGEATVSGHYTCIVTAVWQMDDLVQTISQTINFTVGEAVAEPMTNVVTYGATGWNLQTAPSTPDHMTITTPDEPATVQAQKEGSLDSLLNSALCFEAVGVALVSLMCSLIPLMGRRD